MTAPIKTLGDFREEALKKLKLVLEVPRWFEQVGVHIYVTYTLADDEAVEKGIDLLDDTDEESGKTSDLQLQVDTAELIEVELPDGTKLAYKGFGDPELSAFLGIEKPTARSAAAAIFLADGDRSSVTRKVVAWSGYNNEKIAEKTLGE